MDCATVDKLLAEAGGEPKGEDAGQLSIHLMHCSRCTERALAARWTGAERPSGLESSGDEGRTNATHPVFAALGWLVGWVARRQFATVALFLVAISSSLLFVRTRSRWMPDGSSVRVTERGNPNPDPRTGDAPHNTHPQAGIDTLPRDPGAAGSRPSAHRCRELMESYSAGLPEADPTRLMRTARCFQQAGERSNALAIYRSLRGNPALEGEVARIVDKLEQSATLPLSEGAPATDGASDAGLGAPPRDAPVRAAPDPKDDAP